MTSNQVLRNAASASQRWLLPSLAAAASCVGFWKDPFDNHQLSSDEWANDKNQIGCINERKLDAQSYPWLRFCSFLPSVTSLEGPSPSSFIKVSPAQVKPLEFDFVVVGNGNAGRKAVEILREKCQNASIAVVDPYRPCMLDGVSFMPTSAIGFDPVQRVLYLAENRPTLKYRHAVLIATGARGSPPPLSLFDHEALDRVVELHSTALPKNQVRPSVSPEAARQITLMAAYQGAKIGILGSGWEAVELAAATSRAADSDKKPVLAFESPGPLSNVLPRYLSAELSARLRQQGVVVMERSLVRYVQSSRQGRPGSTTNLEVHTAKSYDLLETKRVSVDLLVVAPNVQGARGTAYLPTNQVPKVLDSHGNTPWYQTWSQLTGSENSDPSMIACYADDGRIAVNVELCAASRVYAAGSVAKYSNVINGHTLVAGEGPVDGAVAGHVAALNMSRDYHERKAAPHGNETTLNNTTTWSFAQESLPLWRSDVCWHMIHSAPQSASSSLDEIGIRALCVGNCDAERLTTCGFWWTNTAAQQRMLSKRYTGPDSTSHPSRHRTGRRQASRTKPVYGVGIVFYLDEAENVKGIMLWGLPYAKENRSDINQVLLGHIKCILSKDGGTLRRKWENGLTISSSALTEESEKIIAIALGTSVQGLKTNRTIFSGPGEPLPKPLCRCTTAKTAEAASLGFLRRRDRLGMGLLGEDTYVPYQVDDDLLVTNSAAGPGWGNTENTRIFLAWQDNEFKSRPPKEDPLWLRLGDAFKASSVSNTMAQRYYSNLYRGQLADGSDPQATLLSTTPAKASNSDSINSDAPPLQTKSTDAPGSL